MFAPRARPALRACEVGSLASVPLRCWKDYDGERCEIHSLGTKTDQSGGPELTQTVLIIITVVLLAVSCLVVLLMACAQ